MEPKTLIIDNNAENYFTMHYRRTGVDSVVAANDAYKVIGRLLQVLMGKTEATIEEVEAAIDLLEKKREKELQCHLRKGKYENPLVRKFKEKQAYEDNRCLCPKHRGVSPVHLGNLWERIGRLEEKYKRRLPGSPHYTDAFKDIQEAPGFDSQGEDEREVTSMLQAGGPNALCPQHGR